MNGNSGEIISTNYPDKYPNNHRCSWTVTVAIGSKIRVVFNSFQVERNAGICYDFVRLFDGPNPTSPVIGGQLCGNTRPADKTTTGNNLIVQLKTDGMVKMKGFNLTWTVQP